MIDEKLINLPNSLNENDEELINLPRSLSEDYGIAPAATPVDCVGNCLPAMAQGCAGNMACVGTCQPST